MKINLLSISENTYGDYKLCGTYMQGRETRIVLHDDIFGKPGIIHNENELKNFLDFFELEMSYHSECQDPKAGLIKFYLLSKPIVHDIQGGFRSMDHLNCITDGKKLNQFKGFSNGKLVDCYAWIGDDVIE